MRPSRFYWLYIALVGAAGVAEAGCGDDLGPGVVDSPPSRFRVAAVVFGSVETADGAVVPGADIEITPVAPSSDTTHIGECVGTIIGLGEAVTDGAGAYRDTVQAGVTPFDVCLAVRAVPPPETSLKPALVSGTRVQMRAQSPGAVLEEVRVDVQVAP